MWRDRQEFRLAIPQQISACRKRIETIGVQDERKLGLQDDLADETLSFRLKSKARTESENGLAFRYALKALLSEILNCGRAFRGCYQRLRHKLRVSGSNKRQDNIGSGNRYQASPGPERGIASHHSSAGLAERAGDHQRVAVQTFVRINRADERKPGELVRLDPAKRAFPDLLDERSRRTDISDFQDAHRRRITRG